MPSLLVALGGNALLKPHEVLRASDQYAAVERTCAMLGEMVAAGDDLVIVHGNGPQVGSLLIQNDDARRDVPPMPLDVLGAESQGQIGYMLQQGMTNELARRGIERQVITVLSRTLVDPDDPGFSRPTKPVGPYYSEAEAAAITREKGWMMRQEPDGWRRVVPSPEPLGVLEAPVVGELLSEGTVVIAAGGGGVPVALTPSGLVGVEAVIDKDLAGQRLATSIGVRRMLILTTVHHVMRDFGKPSESPIERLSCEEARELIAGGQFRSGSMGPKVEAACRFVEQGGECAVIAHLDEAIEALDGRAGTQVVGPDGSSC